MDKIKSPKQYSLKIFDIKIYDKIFDNKNSKIVNTNLKA